MRWRLGAGTRLVEGDLGTPGDLLSGARLVRPIGYANALGALCALGMLLALGLAVTEAPRWARAGAAALLVPLAAALYFTLSRGSDLALVAGLAVLARPRAAAERLGGASPRRSCLRRRARRALAARGRQASPAASARARDTGSGLELAVLAVAAALVALRARPFAERIGRHGRALAVAGAVLVAAVLLAALASGFAGRAVHRLEAPPPATGANLNRRVLSVSGNGRTAYWRVARGMVARDPLLGAGAGSYERWWLQARPTANAARNAHDLYLETLAELGPLGLALLVLALGVPLWVARRARGMLASAALAAYVAWLVHALLDWDWQIPAVTLPALACAAAVLVLARDDTERSLTLRLRLALGSRSRPCSSRPSGCTPAIGPLTQPRARWRAGTTRPLSPTRTGPGAGCRGRRSRSSSPARPSSRSTATRRRGGTFAARSDAIPRTGASGTT